MIVFRRVAAVVLGIIFVVATISSAVFLRVKETALNDDFYVNQLRQANIYNFLYDSVIPLAFEELSKQDLGDTTIDFSQMKPHAVAAIKQAIPPAWLQQQTEEAIHQFVPYATGATDEFAIQVPVADRIKATGDALKKAIHDSKFVDVLFEDVLAPEIRDALKDPNAVPFGVSVSADELVASIRRIVPNEWLEAQIFAAIDALVPYLIGEVDSFSVQMPVSDRMEAARAELKLILQKANLRDFIFKNVLGPMVQAQIGANLAVPFGLSVTSADVQTVLRGVLTDVWFTRQTDAMVDATVDYLSGRTQTFSLTVPLADLKNQAVLGVGNMMDAKLAETFNRAPVCTLDQLRTLDYQRVLQSGITCRPAGVTLADMKAVAGITNYQQEVARIVDRSLPADFTFNEASLRSSLGQEQWTRLQDIRKWTLQGFSFDSAELEETLAESEYNGGAPSVRFDKLQPAAQAQVIAQSENVERLRDFRGGIKKGFSFTQVDLQKQLEKEDPQSLQTFNDVRNGIGLAIGLSILGWLIPAVLLVLIGILGGRTIPTKIIWSAAFLLFAALVLFVAAGPAYNRASQEVHANIESAFADAGSGGQSALEQALVNKGKQMAINATDDFFSGIARRGLILVVLSIVAIGGAVAWSVLEKRRASPQLTEPAEPA